MYFHTSHILINFAPPEDISECINKKGLEKPICYSNTNWFYNMCRTIKHEDNFQETIPLTFPIFKNYSFKRCRR